MAEEAIDVRVRLRGARKAATEAHAVARGVDDIGDQASQADRKIGGFAGASGLAETAVLDLGTSAEEAAGSGGKGGGGVGGLVSVFGDMGSVARGAQPALLAVAVILGSYLVAGLAAVIASAVLAAAALAALAVAAGGALVVGMGFAALATQRFKAQANQAGTAANSLKHAFTRVGRTAQEAFGPALDIAMRGAANALRSIQPLIRSLSTPATRLGRALSRAFGTIASALGSPAIRRGIAGLVVGVSKLAGPGADILVSFGQILLNIARSAMPYLIQGFRAVAGWLKQISGPTGVLSFKSLQGIMRMIIPHLQEWFRLGSAIGRIFLGFVRALAPAGLSLVGWLTRGANALARWVNSKEGQRQIKEVMREMVPLIKQIVQFFILLVPIVIAFMRIARPGFQVIFFFLNLAFKAAGWFLGKMIALRNWAASKLPSLSGAIRGLGSAWDAVKSAFSAVWNFIKPKIDWLIGKLDSIKNKADAVIPGGGGGFLGTGVGPKVTGKSLIPHVPGFASGGALSGAGSFFVGERGPELATLNHGRLTVQPLGASQKIERAGVGAGGGGDIVVPVTVLTADGDVLGRTVARSKRKAENAK